MRKSNYIHVKSETRVRLFNFYYIFFGKENIWGIFEP
jgi:hypothetical protein